MNERSCSLPDCGKPHVARGYCHRHYGNWRRTGNPIAVRTYTKGGRTCGFAGCGRPHDCHGLCRGHLLQKMAGKPLAPLGERRKSTDRDEQGRKRCRTCREWLPVDQFFRNAKTADGMNSTCVRCGRDHKMRIYYGITLDTYLQMLERQGGVCAVCGGMNGNGNELAVDHDHRCCSGRKACGNCVRGLLCSACNLGLGTFGEDPDRLDAAAAYLRRTRQD